MHISPRGKAAALLALLTLLTTATSSCRSRNRSSGMVLTGVPFPATILEILTGAAPLDFDSLAMDVPVGVPTQNSNLAIPPQVPIYDFTESFAVGYAVADLSQEQLDAAFLSTSANFPVGDGPNGRTLAADFPLPMIPGRYFIGWNCFEARIPTDDPNRLLQYAYVADADNDPSNNFLAGPPFEGDFFTNTDQWYAAEYAPTLGWRLQVTSARDGSFDDLPSSARVLIAGQAIFFIIPITEFDDADSVSGRYTAFGHVGDFGQQGGDWSADVFPTVGAPLMSLSLGLRY